MKLRPPKPFWERIKLPLILLGYMLLAEWADPFPFYATTPARLAVVLLVLLIAREFHHARMEVDVDWATRTAKVETGARGLLSRVDKQTWLKLQRVVTWTVVLYVFGALVNTLTDRCDNAVQCTALAPRMAAENLPMFIQFALMIALTMLQLGLMFYAMVKVGSYKLVMPGTVGVSFDDVWGQDQAKEKVLEQVKLLEDSDEVEKVGGFLPKGLLLYGPPGTGKTYLAKAAAGYSSKPLILVPPGAFQATFVGINLLKVWTLFRNVRKLSRRYGGVIVFIDEIDSLGNRGGQVEGIQQEFARAPGCVPFPSSDPVVNSIGGSGTRITTPGQPSYGVRNIVVGSNQMGTLEAFLSAMDGMDEPRGLLNRIIVFLGFKPLKPPEYRYVMIGATNMMSALDPALLRAGRFGRKIHVPYPKIEGRLKTYEGYLGKVQHDLTPEQVDWAARNHARGTGAAIKDIVNEALLITFRDDRESAGRVHFDDLVKAMVWVGYGESDGAFERDEARWAVAVHEAGHACAFHYLLRDREQIWFASIEQRGDTGGMVVPTMLHEDWINTRQELFAQIQVSLASRVAEELLLGTTTNGHGGDGLHATNLAERMVNYGHVDQVGVYELNTTTSRRQSEKVLKEALEACRGLLEQHRGALESCAKLLYEKHTVAGDEVHRLLEAA